jgi:hypothetical protein
MTDTEENGNAIPPEEIEGVVHEIKTDDTANTTCCAWRKFEGVETAQGYSVVRVTKLLCLYLKIRDSFSFAFTFTGCCWERIDSDRECLLVYFLHLVGIERGRLY